VSALIYGADPTKFEATTYHVLTGVGDTADRYSAFVGYVDCPVMPGSVKGMLEMAEVSAINDP